MAVYVFVAVLVFVFITQKQNTYIGHIIQKMKVSVTSLPSVKIQNFSDLGWRSHSAIQIVSNFGTRDKSFMLNQLGIFQLIKRFLRIVLLYKKNKFLWLKHCSYITAYIVAWKHRWCESMDGVMKYQEES